MMPSSSIVPLESIVRMSSCNIVLPPVQTAAERLSREGALDSFRSHFLCLYHDHGPNCNHHPPSRQLVMIRLHILAACHQPNPTTPISTCAMSHFIAGPSRLALRRSRPQGHAALASRLYSSCSSGSAGEQQRLLTCRPTSTPEQGVKDRSTGKKSHAGLKGKRMTPTSSLAIRRASLFASQSSSAGRPSTNSDRNLSSSSSSSTPLSSYLDTLRSPSNANFEAVHLYHPQFARLQSTVPSYMPLPVHAKKLHQSAAEELFVRPSETARQQGILTALAALKPSSSSSRFPSALQGHLAIAHALEPNATSSAWETSRGGPDFALLSLERDNDPETSGMAKAEQDWMTVLDRMDGKTKNMMEKDEAVLASEAESAAADLQAAVAEVDSLLKDLDLELARPKRSASQIGVTRTRSLRHLGGSASHAGGQDRIRVGRWSLDASRSRSDDGVHMDSVQRKRRKKISKHK